MFSRMVHFFRRLPKTLPRQQLSSEQGHIIITGTGRAGTTLLVQLLTVLGFDTRYSVDEALASKIDPISQAGLEQWQPHLARPYVMKSPHFGSILASLMQGGDFRIRTAIVPMRELDRAAESRRRVSRVAAKTGAATKAHEYPGGLWDTDNPDEQENVLARKFYNLQFQLVRGGIPTIYIEFPRFAQDVDYLFASLRTVWDEHGVSRQELLAAFTQVVRLEKIGRTE